MRQDPQAKQHQAQQHDAQPARQTHQDDDKQAHRLAAQCAGDPAKLRDLLKSLSPALRDAVITDAQQMYGNAFVQRAMQNIGSGYTPAQVGGTPGRTVTPGEAPTTANPTGTTPAQQAAQNRQTAGGELAHPGDFDQSQMLSNLIDPKPTGGGTAPKQSDPASLVSSAGQLPTAADFMTATSRQGNQSDEPAPTSASEPLGPLTEADQKEADRLKNVVATNHTGEDHPQASAPDRPTGADTREYPLTWDNLSLGRIWAQITRPLTDDSEKFKPQPQFTGFGTRGMPDPNVEGGGDHVSATIPKDQLPSVATAIADRQRQTSMPNETSNQGPRLHANMQEALVETQRRQQAGRIDPADGDGTTTNLGSGTPAPAPGSGIEQVDGTPTNRPGKHPDEE